MNSTEQAKPLDSRTMHSRAYDWLREYILSGQVAPGDRLDERMLAEAMGISRTPIREAIAMLASERLIERRPYDGNYVRILTPAQISQLYDVRKHLEALATRLAVERLTDESFKVIDSVLSDIEDALNIGDMSAYALADQRFHGTIVELAQNEFLVTTLRPLESQIQLARTMANRDPEVVVRTMAERHKIRDAFRDRDVEAAVEFMEAHIEGVKRSLLDRIGTTTDQIR